MPTIYCGQTVYCGPPEFYYSQIRITWHTKVWSLRWNWETVKHLTISKTSIKLEWSCWTAELSFRNLSQLTLVSKAREWRVYDSIILKINMCSANAISSSRVHNSQLTIYKVGKWRQFCEKMHFLLCCTDKLFIPTWFSHIFFENENEVKFWIGNGNVSRSDYNLLVYEACTYACSHPFFSCLHLPFHEWK